MPLILASLTCRACGIEQHFTEPPPPFPRCTDCGADLRPPAPKVRVDQFHWSTRAEIEAGAEAIRRLVEERKKRG